MHTPYIHHAYTVHTPFTHHAYTTIPLYFAMVACMMRKHFAHSSSTLGVWWCTLPMRMKRTDATRKSA